MVVVFPDLTRPMPNRTVLPPVLAELDRCGVADDRITLPLHAAVFRAPLCEAMRCDAVIAGYGPTGALKSALFAVVQSHFGNFDYNSLPLNWESTANSLENPTRPALQMP